MFLIQPFVIVYYCFCAFIISLVLSLVAPCGFHFTLVVSLPLAQLLHSLESVGAKALLLSLALL